MSSDRPAPHDDFLDDPSHQDPSHHDPSHHDPSHHDPSHEDQSPHLPSAHVLVVGGGITGLATAYRLGQREDRPRVTLVESSDRLGGKLRTDCVDGFVIDAGPESLAPGRPHAARLAAELGIDLVETAPGGPGAVLVKGRLRTMPEGIGGFIPRRIAPLAMTRLFSPVGKVRMAFEAVVPARGGDADESLESFTSRRLGREAYRRLVEPVASGIFCGDPATLSLLATMPHLRNAEKTHGGLLRAVLAERKSASASPAGPRRGLMSPATGMGAIVDALVSRIYAAEGTDVLLRTRLVRLIAADGAYVATVLAPDGSSQELRADAVVIATPTGVAADVLASLGADAAASILRDMTTASTVTVSLGYLAAGLPDLDALLPAHGYLVAEPGRGPVRSVTRSSAKFAGRAPEGHELFRVTVRADDDPSDGELVSLARAELGRTLGISAVPVVEHVHRWTDVMPQYAVGHLDRVVELEEALEACPGVVVAGSGVDGLGIPDCVASAERAAANVALVPS
jgi:oxygen-dependent protoporphyrinogen oxidase